MKMSPAERRISVGTAEGRVSAGAAERQVSADAEARFTLGPLDRVKKRPRFLEIQQRGRKIHTPHFVVAVLAREQSLAWGRPGARLGITVTKKVATAVGRNRVKRLVREVFRCNRRSFPATSDVVVIAKGGAADLSLAQVTTELTDALTRLPRSSASRDRS